jgi:hypothetical protein
VTATWERQRIPLTQLARISTPLRESQPMREHGPPAKYLILPPNIGIKDIVIEVNTKLTEIEHCGEPFDDTSSSE